MKIRNAVIITDADTELHVSIAEQANFTGNVVFSRDKLPADLVERLYRATGRRLSEDDAASADHSRATVQPELVS